MLASRSLDVQLLYLQYALLHDYCQSKYEYQKPLVKKGPCHVFAPMTSDFNWRFEVLISAGLFGVALLVCFVSVALRTQNSVCKATFNASGVGL